MPSRTKNLLSRLRKAEALVDPGPTAVWGEGLLAVHRPAHVHARLAGAGPFSQITDPSGADRARFRTSFLHLQDGGTYRMKARSAGFVDEYADWVDSVERDGDWLVVRRRGRTLAKLREPQMNLALKQDPSRGRIVASIGKAKLESQCVLTTSQPRQSAKRTPSSYKAPALHLREYLDAVCRPKSVVEQRGLLTPDTYRHNKAKRLKHMSLRDVDDRFAAAPKRRPAERLEGTFFHLDNEHRGYYGHALTEQVSRLWAWERVLEVDPDARVLVTLNRGKPVAEWGWTLLEAAGIARERVVVADGPVQVERLLSATPAFSMPKYVHPAIVETWDRIGASLRASAAPVEHPARIFASRRHAKRECLNRDEVEQFFTDLGFTIVFPEEHPLADQVEMFHQASVVAGFAGSGMFTSMFSDRPKHVVLVSPDTYKPSNEYMIGSVRGHRLDVALGTTPAVLPPGFKKNKPLSWPFTFDLSTEGDWIKSVL